MFTDETEIRLYGMLLGREPDDDRDLLDLGWDEYFEDVNTDTVTGALREQEDW